jgi:hypothetical protein
MEIRFRDHASFHRAAVGVTVGSALVGLAVHPFVSTDAARTFGGMAPIVGGVLGLGIGAAFAYGKGVWRIALAMLAVLAIAVPTWQTLLLSSVLLGAGLAIGQTRVRAALTLMVGAAVGMLAMWTALRVTHAQRTATWPGWSADMAAASAMGIVGVLAMLPRHLTFVTDPIRAAMRGLPLDMDSEVRSLCGRSVAIWQTTRDKLGDNDPGLALVRDGVLKALEVATKSSDIKASAATTDEELGRRMEDLDKRIAAATDDEVKVQYQSARAALSDQRRYRDGIRQNRERLVARLHNHVAALEKFQLAAGGLAAVRAAQTGAAAADELADLSHGVAASGEALAEIELATPTA